MAKAIFRPRARLLQLLGDQLIGSSRLAVFELVKNAYDADAQKVDLSLENIDGPGGRIVVTDDGEGMSYKILEEIWMEPGADFRERQKKDGTRTKKFKRLPLGEKGVGRFAIQKLGNKITLVTRTKGEPEYTLIIDWHDLTAGKRYMDETVVEIVESNDTVFKKNQTGTKIIISDLRGEWSRGEIRRLWRNVKSISSPFNDKEVFEVNFAVPEHAEWLSNLPDIKDMLDDALWHFYFWFEDGKFEWEYEFRPIPALKLKGRKTKSEKDAPLILIKAWEEKYGMTAEMGFSKDIGPVSGELYIYDRDPAFLKQLTNTDAIKEFLDENGGVRVYRDSIRVYNYGEKEIDWLGLDLRRVNTPTRKISNNLIIGAIDLSLRDSTGLIEKTSREGFVENDAYERLKGIVLGALTAFENERQADKQEINIMLDHAKGKSVLDLDQPLEQLRKQIQKRNLEKDLGKYLDTVEKKYNEMKDVVTHSGVANLSLAIIFHEVERGVRVLNSSIKDNQPIESIRRQAGDLTNLLEGFSNLLRKDSQKKHDLKSIVEESLFLNQARLEYHNVTVSCPLLSGEQKSESISIARGMMLGALSNLIDNALYWMKIRWRETEYGKGKKNKRGIYIGVSDHFKEGPALIIADNGPGIKLDPSEVVKPFITTKPDGMGLGMYYTNMVMEMNGGKLVFPDAGDVDVPEVYDGAVIALVFQKA